MKGVEKESWLRKSFLQGAHAHLLIVSDGFCNCNAAAFHNNGINTVVVLETAEYRIIRFKLAVKKKGGGVTWMLQCIAEGKDL